MRSKCMDDECRRGTGSQCRKAEISCKMNRGRDNWMYSDLSAKKRDVWHPKGLITKRSETKESIKKESSLGFYLCCPWQPPWQTHEILLKHTPLCVWKGIKIYLTILVASFGWLSFSPVESNAEKTMVMENAQCTKQVCAYSLSSLTKHVLVS